MVQAFSDRERMDKLRQTNLSKKSKSATGSSFGNPSTSSIKLSAKRSHPTAVKNSFEKKPHGESKSPYRVKNQFKDYFCHEPISMVLDTVQDEGKPICCQFLQELSQQMSLPRKREGSLRQNPSLRPLCSTVSLRPVINKD